MEVQKKAYEVHAGATIRVKGGGLFFIENRKTTPAFCHFKGRDGSVVRVRIFAPVTVVQSGGAL